MMMMKIQQDFASLHRSEVDFRQNFHERSEVKM